MDRDVVCKRLLLSFTSTWLKGVYLFDWLIFSTSFTVFPFCSEQPRLQVVYCSGSALSYSIGAT